MKRDMELVRELLLKLEALDLRAGAVAYLDVAGGEIDVGGFTPDQVVYNLELLCDAGFVRGKRHMSDFEIAGLSWQGHEFLNSVRNPEVWRRTKEGVKKLGGVGLELAWEMAKTYGKHVIKERLNLDLG